MKEINLVIDDKTPNLSVECPHCNAKESVEASAYTINEEGFFRHGVHYGHSCNECGNDFIFVTFEDELPPTRAIVVGKRASFGISGIKCDRKGCGYADMTVQFEDYPKWLNKPCPSCGDTLLTEEHLKEAEAMIMTTQLMNDIDDDTLKKIAEQVGDISPEHTRAMISQLPQSMQDAFKNAGLLDAVLDETTDEGVPPSQADNHSDASVSSGSADSGASASTSDTGASPVSFSDGGAGGF